MNIPKNLLYTKEHEWVKIEGNKATMGITDYAQNSLGDITFVELPEIGREVKQSGEVATVESVKAASSIYAPLSGKISKTNNELQENPEIVNKSPYEKGWLAVMEIADSKEKDNLLTPEKYKEFIKGL